MSNDVRVFQSDGVWFVVNDMEAPISISRRAEIALEVARRLAPVKPRPAPASPGEGGPAGAGLG